MGRSSSTSKDALALFRSLGSAFSATPTTLKVLPLRGLCCLHSSDSDFNASDKFDVTIVALHVVYVAVVGSFPFNSFLSGVLSSIGTAVLAVCLRIQVNKENKEFKDLPPERAFADFVLCNLVLHLVIMNFLG